MRYFTALLSKYRNNNLRIKMIAINVLIAIIPILIFQIAFNFVYSGNVKKNVSNTFNILFEQVNGRLEEHVSSINRVSKIIFFNKELQDLLVKQPDDNNYEDKNKILTQLGANTEMNESIRGISIIPGTTSENGYFVSSTSFILYNDLIRILNNADKKEIDSGSLNFILAYNREGVLFDDYLAIRAVKNILKNNQNEIIGYGILLIERRLISNLFINNSITPNTEFFIVDNNDKIISASTIEYEGLDIKSKIENLNSGNESISYNNSQYLLKSSLVKELNWKVIAIVPEDELFKDGRIFSTITTVIIFIVFLIVFWVTLVFNLNITKPLILLADAFKRFAGGDMKTRLVFKEKNEITVIASSFNKMVEDINEMTSKIFDSQQKLFEIELEKKQFELSGLQSQINSHFLYNTLNTIRGMTLNNEKKETAKTIDKLVSFLRYSSSNDNYLSVRDEINHLNNYIAIQNARFGGRYKVITEIDNSFLDYKILKLILQPIVENAIVHGLNEKTGRGIIKIKINMRNDIFEISILDNGIGMKAEQLAYVQNTINKNSGDAITNQSVEIKRSIGIINIHRRIQIYYGNKYGLTIKSWENKGTAVLIILPFKKQTGEEYSE